MASTYVFLKDPITSAEVANEYGINVRQQLELIKSGRLPAYRLIKDLTPSNKNYVPPGIIGASRYIKVTEDELSKIGRQNVKTSYFDVNEVNAISSSGPPPDVDTKIPLESSAAVEEAYKELGSAIDYELKNTPASMLPPDKSHELIDMIFGCKDVRRIINKKIQSKSKNDAYVKRRLRKLGLMNQRLYLNLGRPPKTKSGP